MTFQRVQTNMIQRIETALSHYSPRGPGDDLLDPHRGNDLCAWVNSYCPRPNGGYWTYESITRAARKLREQSRASA